MRAERRIDERAERRLQDNDQGTYAQLQVSVVDVMERDVTTIPEDTSLESVTWALLERRLSGAPVVDRAGRLMGFVSMSDIVRERIEQGENLEMISPRGTRRTDRFEEAGMGFFPIPTAATAREVMSEDVVALSASASLHRAILLMGTHGIERLTILGQGRRVVGVLSAKGILRWLASQARHPSAS